MERLKNFKILVIAIVTCIGLVIYSLGSGGPFVSDVLGTVTSPLLSAGTGMTEGAKEFINLDGMSKEELKTLYLELYDENRKLREQLVDYHDLKEENDSYKSILSVKDAMPDLDLTAAQVVGRDPGDVFYGFSINRGYVSGIAVGDAVITETGIVGVIEEVYATSSRVRSILSEKSQIGAAAKEYGESGVITSDIRFAENGRVRMRYLEKDTLIRAGSIITTSGTGGMFPTDLLIGRAESVERASDGSYYAVVVPYVDVKTISDVFVVTGFEGKGELDSNMPTSVPETEDPEMTAQKGNS
ncbi:MAG: rod shape-determining protein MreC [Clostridia bacterium]|nr:rod shape-determining protein MreC [Clostridia bacterium]